MASQPDKNFVYDRDVLIYNTKQESNSVILSMEKYVEKLWNHPYTRKAFPKLKKTKQFRGLSGKKLLIDQYEEAKKQTNPLSILILYGENQRCLQERFLLLQILFKE